LHGIKISELLCSKSKRAGGFLVGSRDGMQVRKQALQALEKSTRMFDVAFDLLKQGNESEAERVRDEARAERTISTLLMAEANNLEATTPSNQHHQSLRGTNLSRRSASH
jgi:hypothetical protein